LVQLLFATCSSGAYAPVYGCREPAIIYEGMEPLLAKRCEQADDQACWILAELRAHGLAVQRDPNRARPVFKRLCELRQVHACLSLAALEEAEGNARTAATILEEACDSGSSRACALIGRLYEHGLGVGQDVHRAVDLNRTACRKDDFFGCTALVRLSCPSANVATCTTDAAKGPSNGSGWIEAVTLEGACQGHTRCVCRTLLGEPRGSCPLIPPRLEALYRASCTPDYVSACKGLSVE
jgi:hypothetical protein